MGAYRSGKGGHVHEGRKIIPNFRVTTSFHRPDGPDTAHRRQARNPITFLEKFEEMEYA
jgi:hypothetical protein